MSFVVVWGQVCPPRPPDSAGNRTSLQRSGEQVDVGERRSPGQPGVAGTSVEERDRVVGSLLVAASPELCAERVRRRLIEDDLVALPVDDDAVCLACPLDRDLAPGDVA